MPPVPEGETAVDDAGLPGELVQEVAERLRQENADLREHGYHLAVVRDDEEGVPLDRAAEAGAPGEDGHWSEVEVQKLPNNDLRIRLRGYTEAPGGDDEQRMAEIVRALLRETLF